MTPANKSNNLVFLLTLVLVTAILLLPSTLLAESLIFVTRWDMDMK